jgi:hypothetical protein
MIFPYSFRRAYLAKVVANTIQVQTTGTTESLTAGILGFCTAPNGIEGNLTSGNTTTTLKMVVGSWHTVDQIAPFYGGLKAPYYSKAIDARRVTRFIHSIANPAQQQIIIAGWDKTSGSVGTGPVFYCGEAYMLRLDMIGSPALRLLNHQIYVTLPAYGGCCGTDCSSGCTASPVDAACIMLQWNDFMRYGTYNPGIGAPAFQAPSGEIPYLKQFFLPAVFVQTSGGSYTATQVYSQLDYEAADAGKYGTAEENAAVLLAGAYSCNTANPASVVAGFQLTGAYYQTNYNNCTFTPSDYFEIEPIFCKTSLMTGNFSGVNNFSPCGWTTTINTSVPNMVAELQAPIYPKGLGEQVVREIIQSERYRQDHFADSIFVDSYRMREIENQDWILNNVNRQGYYDSVAIVYNIFRPQNSQSVHDNDEYTEIVYVQGTYDPATNQYTPPNVDAFTNILTNALNAVYSPVTLETTVDLAGGTQSGI